MNWNSDGMTCEQARAAIADSIIGGIPSGGALDAHLATCAACRSFRAESTAMWDALGGLPVPAPAPNAHARFEKAVSAAVRADVPSRSVWTRRSLLAASLVGALLLGYGAASWRNAPRASGLPAAVATQQYLLLLYDTQSFGLELTPAQIASTVAEYSAWASGLGAQGKLVSAEKLADTPSEWFGGPVVASQGERIGGFFLIRASDITEARRIAADCPHVKHGGRVELRAIQKT